jgi:hypothetical protein
MTGEIEQGRRRQVSITTPTLGDLPTEMTTDANYIITTLNLDPMTARSAQKLPQNALPEALQPQSAMPAPSAPTVPISSPAAIDISPLTSPSPSPPPPPPPGILKRPPVNGNRAVKLEEDEEPLIMTVSKPLLTALSM